MEAKIREAGCYGPNPDPFWPIAEWVVVWLPVPAATEVVKSEFLFLYMAWSGPFVYYVL